MSLRAIAAWLGLIVVTSAACTDLNPVQPNVQPQGPTANGNHRVNPYPGGFSGNGSIHALIPRRPWITRVLIALGLFSASACTDLNPVQPSVQQAQPGQNGNHRVYPYPLQVGGNGSIHLLVRVRNWFGRWVTKHYRWDVPVATAGPNRDGKIRVGQFRFKSALLAATALDEAKRTMIVHDDGGVVVLLDVPLWERVHPANGPEQEVQLYPRPGETLTVQM